MKTKRLIYIFPNLITITYVFAGFLSIHATIQGRYSRAALLIILAAVLDAFDGIIARATGTQSEFGAWLDSLRTRSPSAHRPRSWSTSGG